MPNPVVDILIPYDLSELQVQALHVWLATISAKLERRRPFARRNQAYHDMVREQRELYQLRLQLWLEETENPQLQSELSALNQIVRQKVHHYWHVGVTDGQQLDVLYPITNAVRPFSVDLQAFRPMNWEHSNASTLEICDLIEKLGAIPKYRIQLIGFSDSPDDYLLCGYMSAELAREYQAYAKVILRPNFYTARGESDWTHRDTQDLAQSLGGVSHDICYNRSTGTGMYQLLDADAMREWAKHDRFHLHF